MYIVEEMNSNRKEEGIEVQYLYRLLKSEYHGRDVFGIEVERKDIVQGKTVNIERNSVKLISPKIEKVRNMLFTLYRGEVSPIHLIDILGEDIDTCVFDF